MSGFVVSCKFQTTFLKRKYHTHHPYSSAKENGVCWQATVRSCSRLQLKRKVHKRKGQQLCFSYTCNMHMNILCLWILRTTSCCVAHLAGKQQGNTCGESETSISTLQQEYTSRGRQVNYLEASTSYHIYYTSNIVNQKHNSLLQILQLYVCA